jgi:hypothetical protein
MAVFSFRDVLGQRVNGQLAFLSLPGGGELEITLVTHRDLAAFHAPMTGFMNSLRAGR